MSQFGQIGFTEEQIDVLNGAETFCRDHAPIGTVRALITSDLGYDDKVWAQIGALGWLGIAIPETYGGLGLSLTEVVPVCEQMGRRMMASPFLSTSLAAQALIVGGTLAQKSKILPQIAQGKAASLALSERNQAWDLTRCDVQARRTQGGYVLTGTKTLVLDLEAAEWIIVSANLDQKACLFIVEKEQILETAMRREILIDETKRGWEWVLDGTEITEEACLDKSKMDAAFKHIHLTATLLFAAELTGGAQACIDYTVEYLNTRKQFDKLIGSFQALKHPVVDAFVEYQKARSLLYMAAFNFYKPEQGEVATRMAFVQADKTLSFAADRSIQFHGGFGFTYDCDAHLYRRRAIFNTSQYGDRHYHKTKLADLLL